MKRSFLISLCLAVGLVSACGGSASNQATMVAAQQTQAAQTALALVPPTAPPSAVPSQTPEPTATDTPEPTATNTPAPDYSVIVFKSLYLEGKEETVLVFALNGVRADFYLMGNDHIYNCRPLNDDPDKLVCRGIYQPPDHEVLYQLYVTGVSEPVMTRDMIIPTDYPPTPVGMSCEIEPLWVAPLTGNYGCYAVTCYIGQRYYDGVVDTCVSSWPWPVP